MTKKVCVVVGVGPGNGAALACKFAGEGYSVALLARTTATTEPLAKSLGDARAYTCDVSDAASVAAAFDAIEREMGPVDTLVYNAGTGTWATVEDVVPAALESAFRVNTLGLLLASQKVIPQMKTRGGGNIVVIGATASRRGAARTAGFAPAKAAQKSLAESMARHLWPAEHPRVLDHRRRRRRPAAIARAHEGQAGRFLHLARRGGRHGLPPRHAAPLRLVVRGRGPPLQGDLVMCAA